MNLKKFGKRILYLVGGIVLVFVLSIVLGTYISDGGTWYSLNAFYLYIGLLSGVGLIIQSFLKNFGEAVKQKQSVEKEPGDNNNAVTKP